MLGWSKSVALARASATQFVAQRDGFIGLCAVLFLASFHQRINGSPTLDNLWLMLKVNGFQCLAWAAAFSCLWRSGAGPRLTGTELTIMFAIALTACVPSELVWLSLTAAAIFIWISAADPWGRAAGTVVLALAGERLWSPMIFAAAEPYLVRLDAVFTGWTFLSGELAHVRHGNVIDLGRGHAIEVLSGCSSFRNISLAILCWVAVTKWGRATWKRADLVVGLAVVVAMFAANLARLHAMALSQADYLYWHTGGGRIFATSTSLLVLTVSGIGASLASRSR